MMQPLSVAFTTLVPESESIEMPDSMHPTDRQFLTVELQKISTEVTKLQLTGEGKIETLTSRLAGVDARLAKLEKKADMSGRHDIAQLQKTLDKERELTEHHRRELRARVWGIVATFLTTAIIGLVAYYFANR